MLGIEKMGEDGVPDMKAIVLGPHGIGKTSLVRKLPEDQTLLLDLEAGKLALGARTENGVKLPAWRGRRVDAFKEAQRLGVPVWGLARDIAVWLGGPSPFVSKDTEPYSALHYKIACERMGDPAPILENCRYLFVDSISVASRACFQWGKGQARAQTKGGDVDTRGLYGLIKDESLAWLTQLQHTPMNVIMVGGLDPFENEGGQKGWKAQIEGSGTANALPGIVDEIITYTELAAEDGSKFRGFVTHTLNPWGYPAKDRSGALDMIEEPDLAKLIEKIRSANA
jgi:hypothetical protein